MREKSFPRVVDTTNERQAHISEAATRVIARKGLAGLTVRAVAEEAGCSRGLVEHYFRNKEALTVAANDWANETYLQRVAAAVGERKGLPALEVRLKELLPYSEQVLDEWRVRVAFWQGVNNPLVEVSTQQSFRLVYEEIWQDMRLAQAGGEIADHVPVRVTSEMVFIMVVGIATLCINDSKLRQPKALDRRVAMMLGLLKSGDLSALQVGNPDVDY